MNPRTLKWKASWQYGKLCLRSGSAEKASEKVGGSEERSLSQAAAGAAVTGIYAGLKLTGFALRVATDMATSLTKEANAALADNEAQRAEKVDSQPVAMQNLGKPPCNAALAF